ncbi:MAG TPA: dodecin family protein [Bacteroidales bacterium]|nr:dodecin family protein [Bacteroidales bacterium]
MSVLKVIEIMANSPESWEDAAQKAVDEATKSVKNIQSVWVKDQSCNVENGKIKQFRVNVKITFTVEH